MSSSVQLNMMNMYFVRRFAVISILLIFVSRFYVGMYLVIRLGLSKFSDRIA